MACTIDDALYYTNHLGERVAPPEPYETPAMDFRNIFTDAALREILEELKAIRKMMEEE